MEELGRETRQSVKSMTSVTNDDQAEISSKIKTQLDSDPDLHSWYKRAESFLPLF